MHIQNHTHGFTLIELLVAISITVVIAALSIPLGLNFLRDEALVSSGNDIVQVLRLAQINSKKGDQDSRWGVHAGGTTYTYFRGTTYATRDTSYDLSYDISGLSFSTTTEIVFEPVTGYPTQTNPNEFGLTDGQRTRLIQVNQIGRINLTDPEILGGS